MIVEGEWRVDEIEMAYIAVPIEGTNDARLLPVWRFQTEHTMEYAGKDGQANDDADGQGRHFV